MGGALPKVGQPHLWEVVAKSRSGGPVCGLCVNKCEVRRMHEFAVLREEVTAVSLRTEMTFHRQKRERERVLTASKFLKGVAG